MAEPITIYTDEQTRRLYANDASMYEELPEAVAFPRNKDEIRQLITQAHENGTSLTARAAGTSLAGQATGSGIVMDVSRHFTEILELNPEKRYARVQPGVIRDTLNRAASKHGLIFGPDTATTNRCMIGGMIGNNSCGSFSIKYGTTRDHILEIEAILSDGSTAVFKPVEEKELERKLKLDNLEGDIYRGMVALIENNRDQILDAYPHPDIIRRNTGYALDRMCEMRPFNPDGRPFNLAELLCGSEGTLAVTASARLNLVNVDPHKLLLIPHFKTIRAAMEATVKAVELEPAAVELIDHVILDATKDNLEQKKNRFFLEGEPHCILFIQFEGSDIEDLNGRASKLASELNDAGLGYSFPMLSGPGEIARAWELRKAGLGLLMGLGKDSKTPSFCEDTAVRVQDLPDYVDDFQELLEKYETDCVFYAHASVGELHLRPVIDIQSREGIKKMKLMAEEIADLVRSYNGSLSGEHGDGRARAPYIEKVLGLEMLPLLRQTKEIWDPGYIFNPGKIVKPKPIDRDLRYSPAYEKPDVDTVFNWRKEEGFDSAIELCNGAGVCRKLAESGGTMCPSYMATREEKDSTRGRANLFRQLFSGLDREAFTSGELRDALDLCLSCKACKSECPANVDMAKMKAEFMQGWHERNGVKLSERFFGEAGLFYSMAAILPRVTNWFNNSPVGKELLKTFANVHPDRQLPRFASQTFLEWHKSRGDAGTRGEKGRVALLVDIFTNYHDPGIGISAVKVLESLGYEVVVPDIAELGRTQISKGLIEKAGSLAKENIPKLYNAYISQDMPLIGLEPSELLTLRDEYPDLCSDGQVERAQKIADNAFLFEEFVSGELSSRKGSGNGPGAKEKVYVHGHCHAKALVGTDPVSELLRNSGYEPEVLDTGCCGMAGSFGYEADHYDVSMEIGELVLFPALRKLPEDALICAPGFSCRHQIKDGTGRRACHPAELAARTLI